MVLINPFALSHVTYKNKVELPNSPGIYYVLNLSKNEIIYIGQSKNIRTRWKSHHRDWDIGMFQTIYENNRIVIAWELCATSQLSALERRRIKELDPVLNGKNYTDTENSLFGKDNLDDSPEYYHYLTGDLTQKDFDSEPERVLNYLKAKAKLLGLFNHRHPFTNQFIPRYRFFEEDCLMTYAVNFDKDPLYAKYTNEIHELVNNDLRIVLNYVKCPEVPWNFKGLGWSAENVVHALTHLFGHFVEADIKAIDAVVPVKNFHELFLERIKSSSVEAGFLSILRPIYRKAARRNWEMIHLGAVADLDGRLHDTFTPDESPEK